MNKYIEKIYDEDTKLHIHLSKDFENAPEKALEDVFDFAELNTEINAIKNKCFECFYTDAYVHIPNGVTCIKKHAFYHAFDQIHNVYRTAWYENRIEKKYYNFKFHYNFPDGLKRIEDDIFYISNAYTLDYIPESVEYIGSSSLRFDGQKTLILPKNVLHISEGAFSFSCNCELIIKDNPRYFTDGYALYDKQEKMLLFYFGDAKECRSYKLWEETEKISPKALRGAFYDYLREVIFPKSIKKIEDETFECVNIKRIILESFDTEVSDFAVRYPVKVVYPDGTSKKTKGFKSHYQDYLDYKANKPTSSIQSNATKPSLEKVSVTEKNKAEEIIITEEKEQNIIENKPTPKTEVFIQPELDIDKISKMVEEHKNNFNLSDTKNPFDFDENEIFDGIDYDYNIFDDDNKQK